MKYWDEFATKYGFNDGDTIPPDAQACRFVYVAALNKLLKKHGSAVRVVPWNRDGCHNCYLMERVPAALFTDEELEAWNAHLFRLATLPVDKESQFLDKLDQHWKKFPSEPATDDAWETAWEEASDLCLDEYVEVQVSIAKEFEVLFDAK